MSRRSKRIRYRFNEVEKKPITSKFLNRKISGIAMQFWEYTNDDKNEFLLKAR